MTDKPPESEKSPPKAPPELPDKEAEQVVHAQARKLGLLPRKDHDSTNDPSLFDDFTSPNNDLAIEPKMQDIASGVPPLVAKKPKTSSPHYHGHRERLKQRLLESDGEALADYELLEAILFNALPRRDTKPIAKELLQRFGSFAEVLNASEGELRKIKWIKDGAIGEFALIKAATRRLLKTAVIERPILTSWAKVLDHCRAAMAFEPREQFRILFLDKRNRLILDEVQQTGTIDHTPVYVREICRRALEVNATALILAHNHPSGDPTPSRGDIEMTREIVKVAKGLGISVHDHIIIAKEGHASFKGLGLI